METTTAYLAECIGVRAHLEEQLRGGDLLAHVRSHQQRELLRSTVSHTQINHRYTRIVLRKYLGGGVHVADDLVCAWVEVRPCLRRTTHTDSGRLFALLDRERLHAEALEVLVVLRDHRVMHAQSNALRGEVCGRKAVVEVVKQAGGLRHHHVLVHHHDVDQRQDRAQMEDREDLPWPRERR